VPTLAFGIGTIVAAVAGSAVGEGLGSLLAVLVWFIWITVLAIRMLRLAQRGGLGAPARSPLAPRTHV
jgi:tellurite resistance protein TehA-like permease